MSNKIQKWHEQFSNSSTQNMQSPAKKASLFFKAKAEKFRLPWYLNEDKVHSSMVLLKSVAKEVAVRAVYFPDQYIDKFEADKKSKFHAVIQKDERNAYTKNIKDVVINEKFDKVLAWCLDEELYKGKRKQF
jgi:hypothetical protein